MSAQYKYHLTYTHDQCLEKRLVPLESKSPLDWWDLAAKGIAKIATRMCYRCNKEHQPGEYAMTDCEEALPAREEVYKEIFPERSH